MTPRRICQLLYALHLLLISSIALSNIALGLTLLALPWAVQGIRMRWWRGSVALWAALLAYMVLLVAAIVASTEPTHSLRALSELFSLTTLPLALWFFGTEREARRLVDGVIVVAVVIAGSGLFQFLIGYGDIDNRIRGPLSHYMTFSGVLLVADLLLLGRMPWREGWKKPWHWVALLVLNVALLGSLTRSAWVALGVALAILLLATAPRLLLLAPLAALTFIWLAPVPVIHRMASIVDLTDASNYDRLCMARAGVTMVAERPWFGIGPDVVAERYPLYRDPTAPRFTVPHLHNSFLQVAAERGLPALLAFLALLAVPAVVAVRRFRAGDGVSTPAGDLCLGAFLAIVGFAVAGLFENNWGDTEVQRMVLFAFSLPFVAVKRTDPA